jgi:hypothetical protein
MTETGMGRESFTYSRALKQALIHTSAASFETRNPITATETQTNAVEAWQSRHNNSISKSPEWCYVFSLLSSPLLSS